MKTHQLRYPCGELLYFPIVTRPSGLTVFFSFFVALVDLNVVKSKLDVQVLVVVVIVVVVAAVALGQTLASEILVLDKNLYNRTKNNQSLRALLGFMTRVPNF